MRVDSDWWVMAARHLPTNYSLLVTRLPNKNAEAMNPGVVCCVKGKQKRRGCVPSASAANKRSRYRGTLLAAAAAGTAAQLNSNLLE